MTTNTVRLTAKLAKLGITDIPVTVGISESHQVCWYDQSHCPSTNRVQRSVWTDGQKSLSEEWTDSPKGFFGGGTKGTSMISNATYVIVEVEGRNLNGSTWKNATLEVAETISKAQEAAIVQAVAKYRFGTIAKCPGFLQALSGQDTASAQRWLLKTLKADRFMEPREGERLIITFVGGDEWADRVYFTHRHGEWHCSDHGIATMMKKFGIDLPGRLWEWQFPRSATDLVMA
jgi:hypothetical protein